MSVVPAIVVDAPRPVPPLYTLIDAPITDAAPPSDDHFTAGIELFGYPQLAAMGAWWSCPPGGSTPGTKTTGGFPAVNPFKAFTVYLGLKCSTLGITPDELDERAQIAFNAYEHYLLERQVWTGAYDESIPHLSDANATIVSSSANKLCDGFALLEQAIAKMGRQCVIHASPAVVSEASARYNQLVGKVGNHLETILGTTVIPGQGYWEGDGPDGQAANTGTQEWIYATTPFIVRRGAIFVPENQFGIDRANNVATVWVERDYVYAWSQTLQAAVKVDRVT